MSFLAKRSVLREDTATLLAELGGTASEVAVFLESVGVRVRSTTPAQSPAESYLHAVIGADVRVDEVEVGKRRLVLKSRHGFWRTVRVRLPDPVREFVASIVEPAGRPGTEVPWE